MSFVASNLNSVEINGTFYALQNPKSFKKWARQTGENFVFSIKASRYITHVRRLRDIEIPMANFFASGMLQLEEKLGPFLWQFPPTMKLDMKRFERFFNLLPKNSFDASSLAAKHDQLLSGRSRYKVHQDFPIRHAIEVRNASFNNKDFFDLLRKHNVALVMSHAGDKWPFFQELTADFVYARLHGVGKLYESGYSYQALAVWKREVKRWLSSGLDVFVYFDNDVKTHAPFNAMYLAQRLGGKHPPDFDDEAILHGPF